MESNTNNKIYLLYAFKNKEAAKKRIKRIKRPVYWIYFGRDYVNLKEWEAYLKEGFIRISYSKELQDIATKLLKSYVEWVAGLSLEYKSISWWSSLIAEKNTAVYSLYHNICYFYIAQNIKIPFNSDLIIIAESKFLLWTIAEKTDFKDKIQWIVKPSKLFSFFHWIIKMVLVWGYFFLNGMKEILLAKLTKDSKNIINKKAEKKRVLIHTCIEENYFGPDGKAHDRYFTVLPDKLRDLGCEVIVIPWLFNIKRSYHKALKWFREHRGDYLIPVDYYNLYDYLWAASKVIKQILLPSNDHYFQGMDISLLIKEIRRIQALNIGAAKFVCYYRLIKKLSNSGIKFDIFIDTFENMIPEKPQVIAFREYMPEVKTIGFQHYIAPYPLWLCLYTTEKESNIAPLPDFIVCNSNFTRKIFIDNGFPQEKLRVGPSLRYLSLMSGIKNKTSGNCVLVVLTLDQNAVIETIYKILDAFEKEEEIKFLLKPHPMMDSNNWKKITNKFLFPSHMIITNESMDKIIEKAICAIVMVSTSALELLFRGVPVIMLGRETDFDMNPLSWFSELRGPVYTKEELRKELFEVISRKDEFFSQAYMFSKRYYDLCLNNVDDNSLSQFTLVQNRL